MRLMTHKRVINRLNGLRIDHYGMIAAMILRRSELIAWLNEQEGDDPEVRIIGHNGHETDVAEYGWLKGPYLVIRCASPDGQACIKNCIQG